MDAVLEKAVDLAYDAAVEAAGDRDAVGAHVSASDDADRLLTHLFACTLPGYRGWVWAVTLARPPRGRDATVCEAHLIPADDALLAPSWVPWADRVRPGDLEPSMVLPMIIEDQRLMPGYEATGEDADALEIWELGLGRERVLAPEGRDSAVERWYRGSHGPTAASAIASTAPCSTCAFFVPLSGAMRVAFGACANEWSPSDGRVVSIDHGCGAHSQTDVEKQVSKWPAPDPVIDTDAADAVRLDEADNAGEADEPEQSEQPEPTDQSDEAPQPESSPTDGVVPGDDAGAREASQAAGESLDQTDHAPEAQSEPDAHGAGVDDVDSPIDDEAQRDDR
ncbi:DUF3027 domain-containing protein [Demequina muriae]|uniref:DUF3027 domain-containing protein n=1 Tax=Demequina muriae TaxID=3051664 RepID=A0ABT8GFA1_9MICO|nr:DUF3027 domain-containing protein [Demequina sp. EGI L300058]MDN4480113.1 DUF3027 domain-containing protein [Demequina sp. EGI L300058]